VVVTLSVFEEIVLLGLDDATGKCISSYAQYSWKAGVLAELLLSECIAIRDRDIEVRCTETGSDDILEESLACLRARQCSVKKALRLSLAPHGRDRILHRLVGAGVLEEVENTVLGLFHFRRYPAHGGEAEGEIRGRLRKVVDGAVTDQRSLLLLSIVRGARLESTFLSKADKKLFKDRIDQLVAGEPIGRALRQVIEEEEAAATTAAIIAATS